jgi:hypothetical protein
MDPKSLVPKALITYDENKSKYSSFFDKIHFHKIVQTNKELERNNITFYDKNKKKLFETPYEIIGLYNHPYQMWTWAWSVPSFEKKSTYISRRMLFYGLDLDQKNMFLKSELILSRFRITDKIQLDTHVALSSYLTKQKCIYEYTFYPSADSTTSEGEPVRRRNTIDSNDYVTYYLYLINEPTL